MKDLQSKIEQIIGSSPTLDASANTIMIVTAQIIDYLKGNYVIERKEAWYGQDWEAQIKHYRKQLAIAYTCKRRAKCINHTPINSTHGTKEKQLQLMLW